MDRSRADNVIRLVRLVDSVARSDVVFTQLGELVAWMVTTRVGQALFDAAHMAVLSD